MKTLNFYKLIILFFAVTMIFSCVKDDDYDIPNLEITEPELLYPVVSINSIAGTWEQDYEDVTFEENEYVEGFVISNDEFGNFYEEIIIQDKLENPTIGIRVLIDDSPLFTSYELGRKIYINLKGLTAGISNGVLTLGVAGPEYIEEIPGTMREDIIVRSATVGTLVPLDITIEELPELDFDDSAYRLTNRLLKISDVQFSKNDVVGDSPISFAGESGDSFDGERDLESCASESSIIFSTSTFADFANHTMPSGRGSITGILTKNFYGDEFNFVVNNLSDIQLDNVDRCDPEVGFFSEDFESFSSINNVEAAGWTNVNVSGGSTEWVLGDFDNNKYLQISGFNSGESDIDVWMITPGIDMDNSTNEALTFDVQTNYDNGDILNVYYSTNFTGDVLAATWTELSVAIPSGPSGGFGEFENVGNIDISNINGTVHFGFFYEGSDPDNTTRYHVDNLNITGN